MQTWKMLRRRFSSYVDSYSLQSGKRWAAAAFLSLYLVYRIATFRFIGVMYFLCLYVLSLVVQFYTPLGLPDPDQDDPNQIIQLPYTIRSDDQPALRSITEFNFWKRVMLALMAAIFCTFFQMFLIPAYWPFLLSYFLVLIFGTVRKHYRHMKKYGYSLGDFGRRHPSRG